MTSFESGVFYLAFGRRVRELRTVRKLSQARLAALSEVEDSYVSDVERAKCRPTLCTAKKLASGFGIPLSQLLEGL